jgi:hypothetical protein
MVPKKNEIKIIVNHRLRPPITSEMSTPGHVVTTIVKKKMRNPIDPKHPHQVQNRYRFLDIGDLQNQ